MTIELSIFNKTPILSLDNEFSIEAVLESELELMLQNIDFVGSIALENSLEDLYRQLLNKTDGISFEERDDPEDGQYCLIISNISGASIVIPSLAEYVLTLS